MRGDRDKLNNWDGVYSYLYFVRSYEAKSESDLYENEKMGLRKG